MKIARKERYEILEVEGIKLDSEKLKTPLKDLELIGFKPEKGQVSWINLGESSKDRITNTLCDSLHELNKSGLTEAEKKGLIRKI